MRPNFDVPKQFQIDWNDNNVVSIHISLAFYVLNVYIIYIYIYIFELRFDLKKWREIIIIIDIFNDSVDPVFLVLDYINI